MPDLPGCVAVGRTREEVTRLIEEAIEGHVRALELTNQPVPDASTDATVIGVN